MPGHPENQHLRIGEDGIELIKEFEGWFPNAYLDPVGVWTIGWGHTKDVSPGDHITMEQGEMLLREDMVETENYVKNVVKVELTENQFEALVSLTYNMGIGNLMKSDLLRLLNRGNYDAASNQFARHNTGKDRRTGKRAVLAGLVRRRAAEKALFLTPDSIERPIPEPPAPEEKKGEAGVAPDKPSDATDSPMKDMVTQSRTAQSLLAVLASIVATVAQLLKPLQDNPGAAIVIGMGGVAIVAALYFKYRDTKAGR